MDGIADSLVNVRAEGCAVYTIPADGSNCVESMTSRAAMRRRTAIAAYNSRHATADLAGGLYLNAHRARANANGQVGRGKFVVIR